MKIDDLISELTLLRAQLGNVEVQRSETETVRSVQARHERIVSWDREKKYWIKERCTAFVVLGGE